MERLLMIYSVGDSFTYRSELTTPIVYSSKQEALEDLQLILLEFEGKHTQYHEEKSDLLKEMKSLVLQISKAQEAEKKALKEKSGTNTSLAELQKEFSLLSKKSTQLIMPSIFEFGGNEFEYSKFIRVGEEGIDINLPNLYTVDEYFYYVEKNLQHKIQIDNKTHSKPKI